MPPLSFVAYIKMLTTRDLTRDLTSTGSFPLFILWRNKCKLTHDLFTWRCLCYCGSASSEIETDNAMKAATGVPSPTEKSNHKLHCVQIFSG